MFCFEIRRQCFVLTAIACCPAAYGPMKRFNRHSFLFRAACQGLRVLFVMLATFICACIFLAPFGGLVQVERVLLAAMPFFFRLTVCLLSLFAIAGLFESLE